MSDEYKLPADVSSQYVSGLMFALAAAGKLRELGLNVRIKGTKYYTSGSNATVVSQSVEKGTSVPKGTVIEIRFYSQTDDDRGWEDDP